MDNFDCKALYVVILAVSSRPIPTKPTLQCRNVLITP